MTTLRVEAELFRVLGHPFRLQLLEYLQAEETCVCHLSAYFAKPQPYVSKQLAELRDAGLVIDRREGQRVYYRLADGLLNAVLDAARAASQRLNPGSQSESTQSPPRYPIHGCECPRCTVE